MTNLAHTEEASAIKISGELAESILSLSSDVVLFLSPGGVIRKVSSNNSKLSNCLENWVGKSWKKSVSSECMEKIDELLNFSENQEKNNWRHINHPDPSGSYFPVSYSTLNIRSEGFILAIGRELSQLTRLQQNLVSAQQDLERDYMRLRQLEARYRMLFNLSTTAIVVLDDVNLEVQEVNPSASALLGLKTHSILGSKLENLFDNLDKDRLKKYLSKTLVKDSKSIFTGKLGKNNSVKISASTYKHERKGFLLVQIEPEVAKSSDFSSAQPLTILNSIENAPDGFVVTNEKGEVSYANETFVEMVGLRNASVAIGDNISKWLVRGRIDFGVMIKTLSKNGILRLFSTHLSGEGSALEVEISAVSIEVDKKKLFTFLIRSTSRRISNSSQAPSSHLSRSAEQLSELVGKLPLKDIVSETTDVIEKLCIESALNLTFNNRVSAAEMLGLSRQSLYIKMKKLNIGESI